MDLCVLSGDVVQNIRLQVPAENQLCRKQMNKPGDWSEGGAEQPLFRKHFFMFVAVFGTVYLSRTSGLTNRKDRLSGECVLLRSV